MFWPKKALNVCEFYCERSKLSGLFKGTDFLYIIICIIIYFRPYVVP